MCINTPIVEQNNTILSAQQCVIGFEGFSRVLAITVGIKTYRKFRDGNEKTLTINPHYNSYCIDIHNFGNFQWE
jgi:hypothetical protein